MLIIVMHNSHTYLEYLAQLAQREGINDFTLVKEKGIGTRLLGGDISFIFTRGVMVEAYEKAFVAVVKGEEKTKRFLSIIESDDYLERLNMQDKGFICALPFSSITNFQLGTALTDEKIGA